MNKSKQYEIPKRAVIGAYQRVKANKGSAGIDGIDFEKFEEKLNNNLYKIWNRMSSGSYFPSPVMAVEIPKKSGGTRRLGIPTITDRVAQMVARLSVEKAVEPMFCEDSYGYMSNRRLSQVISADYFRRKHLSQSAVNDADAHYIGSNRRLSRAYFSSAEAGLK